MIAIFRNSSPASTFRLLFAFVLMRLFLFIVPQHQIVFPEVFIFGTIFKWFNQHLIISFIVNFIVVFATALYLKNLTEEHELLIRRNDLLPYFFLLLHSTHIEVCMVSPVIFTNILVFFGLNKIFQLYKSKENSLKIFFAGIAFGFCCILRVQWIILFLFLIIGYNYFRTFSLKDFFAAVFGFITPIYLLFAIYFLIDWMPKLQTINWNPQWTSIVSFKYWIFSIYPIVTMLSLWSLYTILINYHKNNIKTKRIYQLLVVLLFFSIVFLLFKSDQIIFDITHFSIFFSFLLANIYSRNSFFKLKTLIHWILIITFLIFQYQSLITNFL